MKHKGYLKILHDTSPYRVVPIHGNAGIAHLRFGLTNSLLLNGVGYGIPCNDQRQPGHAQKDILCQNQNGTGNIDLVRIRSGCPSGPRYDMQNILYSDRVDEHKAEVCLYYLLNLFLLLDYNYQHPGPFVEDQEHRQKKMIKQGNDFARCRPRKKLYLLPE